MELIRSFLVYILVLLAYLFVFQRITNRKVTVLPVLSYFVIGSLCTYVLDFFTIMIDPVYLIVFSFFTKRNSPIIHHVFYSFYAVTTVELLSRTLGYVILPTIFQVSTDTISSDYRYLFVTYILVFPFYYLVHYLLHIDYQMIRRANAASLSRNLINLGIGTIIFYTGISILLYIEFQFPMLHFDIGRVRSVFVLIYIIIFIWNLYVINRYAKNVIETQIMVERNKHYRNLDSYNHYIGSLFEEIKDFKESTKDSLLKLGPSIEDGDINQLNRIFDQEFIGKINPSRTEKYSLDLLINLKVPTVKSLLAAKLFNATQTHVHINVEIPDVIEEIPMKIVDFIVVLSVFVDNAIEAAIESKEKRVDLAFFYNDDKLQLVVQNSSKEKQVSIRNMFNQGFSTKGDNRGIGLANVKSILEEYPKVELITKSKNFLVTQELSMTR